MMSLLDALAMAAVIVRHAVPNVMQSLVLLPEGETNH